MIEEIVESIEYAASIRFHGEFWDADPVIRVIDRSVGNKVLSCLSNMEKLQTNLMEDQTMVVHVKDIQSGSDRWFNVLIEETEGHLHMRPCNVAAGTRMHEILASNDYLCLSLKRIAHYFEPHPILNPNFSRHSGNKPDNNYQEQFLVNYEGFTDLPGRFGSETTLSTLQITKQINGETDKLGSVYIGMYAEPSDIKIRRVDIDCPIWNPMYDWHIEAIDVKNVILFARNLLSGQQAVHGAFSVSMVGEAIVFQHMAQDGILRQLQVNVPQVEEFMCLMEKYALATSPNEIIDEALFLNKVR